MASRKNGGCAHFLCSLGTALKKAGGPAFEDEVKALAKDKGPLEVADGWLSIMYFKCDLKSYPHENIFLGKRCDSFAY